MSLPNAVLLIAALGTAVMAVVQLTRHSMRPRGETEELRTARGPEPLAAATSRPEPHPMCDALYEIRPVLSAVYETKAGPPDGPAPRRASGRSGRGASHRRHAHQPS